MSKLEIINSILSDKFLDKNGVLFEEDRDSKGKTFTMKRIIICKNNIKYSLYKYDSKEDVFPFFTKQDKNKAIGKGVTGLRTICDYIFFVEEGADLYIFLVELKKSANPKTKKKAKEQLEAAKCFAEYLISTISRLEINIDLTDNNLHFRKTVVFEPKNNNTQLKKGLEEENGIIIHDNSKDFHIEDYLTYATIKKK